MMTVPKEKLEFHSGNVNQIVHDGINCQACRRMNLKLSGDISAVSDYRVDRYKKMIRYLLVGHTLNQSHDHIFLSVAQLFVAQRGLVDHARNLGTHIILLQFHFSISYGRNKDFFLHLRVMLQPFLIVVDVIEGGTELVVMQSIRRQIFDNDALQLFQLHIHLNMMLREGFNIKFRTGITIDKCLNIREHHLFFILHVISDAMGIIIIELQNEASQIILFIQRFNQFLTDKRQLEIYVIGMRCLETMLEGWQR